MRANAVEAVLGGRGIGDKTDLTEYVQGLAAAGLAVVMVEPMGKPPLDLRSAADKRTDNVAAQATAKAAGNAEWARAKQPAGVHLATTDAARLAKYVATAEKRYGAGAVNLGVEVGRSRLVIVDADTAYAVDAFRKAHADNGGGEIAPTVDSPGRFDATVAVPFDPWVHKDGGHFWFTVQEGVTVPASGSYSVDGWTAYYADRQILIPPSVRPEGPYVWRGGVRELPEWLHAKIVERPQPRASAGGDSSNIDVWSASVPWAQVLTADGWVNSGRVSNCGCPEWTAPGPHDSHKSATAHEVTCTEGSYDASNGHAPLHVWTDNPPEGLRGGGTYSRIQFVANRHYGGDLGAAATALGIPEGIEVLGTGEPLEVAAAEVETVPVSSSWGRVDLGVFARGNHEPVVPTIFPRSDGHCLLYPGLTHSFHGESESGKSLVLQWVSVLEIKAGRHVLFLDYESDPRSIADRLVSMGATVEEIETYFDYRLPETAPDSTQADQHEWVQVLTPDKYSLVVIDGVTASIGTFGASSQSNDEVNAWTRKLPRALATSTGAAVAMVDHVTKDSGTRGRFAIGAQAKMADVTGAAYTVTPKDPVGKGVVGTIRLRVGKDRPSGVRPFCTDYRASDHTHLVGDITVDSTGPVLSMTLAPGDSGPAVVGDGNGSVRRPELMEKISREVEAAMDEGETEWSRNALETRIKGQAARIRAAIKVLVAEGYFDNNPINNRITFARPYRAADDEATYPPLPAGDPFPDTEAP